MKFIVCIPTFKRPHLLAALLDDLMAQTVKPMAVVVVDGDPESKEVLVMLHSRERKSGVEYRYVPSNHANLSYQRYLAFLASEGADYILYLDDDLRLFQKNAVELVLNSFQDSRKKVAAATAVIRFPAKKTPSNKAWEERFAANKAKDNPLVRLLGSSYRAEPGTLTPAGNRIPPLDSGSGYSPVEWLRGGVMAFRKSILDEDFFSDDLFALTKAGCGLGEDTYLGRMAITKGDVIFVHCAVFDHPNADEPKAYPIQAYKMGRATSYSRWFINNTYRGFSKPTPFDRISLYKSLIGASILALVRALKSPAKHRFAFAGGYINGAIKGVFKKPRAGTLFPHIDWRSDARKAIANTEVLA